MVLFGKYSKCFEAHGPLVALAFNWQDQTGSYRKGYIIVDANQKSCGIRLEPERFTEIKTAGAVVALMRKYAPSGILAGVYQEAVTSDYWLPLFTKGPESPSYWLALAHGTPPELRLIDASGQILVRKTSQASFTKRIPLGRSLPSWPLGEGFNDLTDQLKSASESNTNAAQPQAAEGSEILLPDYQRSARDRLARRLKTVSKSLQKTESQATKIERGGNKEHLAQLLQTFLFRVNAGDSSLELTADETGTERPFSITLDPTLTPGQNLARLYEDAKKAARGSVVLEEQLTKTRSELAQLRGDLAELRAAPLSLDAVNAKLKRHGLAMGGGGGASPAAAEATPYRTFEWQAASDAGGAKTRILVGKSAADSDELCRLAKSNDYWIHAVGTTGSHVIIPAREVKGAPAAELLKCAAILALYYSKLRDDMAGEVYISRRQHIKKRSGMAPGLWQIVQAETVYYRYDERELQDALNRAK